MMRKWEEAAVPHHPVLALEGLGSPLGDLG